MAIGIFLYQFTTAILKLNYGPQNISNSMKKLSEISPPLIGHFIFFPENLTITCMYISIQIPVNLSFKD